MMAAMVADIRSHMNTWLPACLPAPPKLQVSFALRCASCFSVFILFTGRSIARPPGDDSSGSCYCICMCGSSTIGGVWAQGGLWPCRFGALSTRGPHVHWRLLCNMSSKCKRRARVFMSRTYIHVYIFTLCSIGRPVGFYLYLPAPHTCACVCVCKCLASSV